MARLLISIGAACTFGVVALTARAHHSFAVHFDPTGLASVQGTVADIRIRSPHSFLELDVEAEDGSIQRWEVETHSIPLLKRVNIDRDTFEIGQTLMVEYMIVDPVYLTESFTGSTQWSRLADGTPIEPFECDGETAAQSTSQGAG